MSGRGKVTKNRELFAQKKRVLYKLGIKTMDVKLAPTGSQIFRTSLSHLVKITSIKI